MKKSLLFFLYSLITKGVFGELIFVSMTEGDSVTLHTGLTETQIKEVIEWWFGDELDRIARIKKNSDPTIYDNVLNEKFRGRLQLNGQTGDLTIRNIKATDSGVYEVSSSINTFKKSFNVTVVPADEMKSVSLTETDFVTLNTDVPDIQRYDKIQWRFDQKSPVAEINRNTGKVWKSLEKFRNTGKVSTYDGPDRLELDNRTGSLTIKNIKTTDSGLYVVDISSSGKYVIHQSFTLTVKDKMLLLVNEGHFLTLHTDTEVYKDDVIQWRRKDTCAAKINKAVKESSACDANAVGFRDRLKLDHQTGSLIITDIRATDSGLYTLDISNNRRTINKIFFVHVIDSGLSAAAVTGIVVGVLVSAAVAAVVIYYRCKISKLKSHRRLFLAAVAEIAGIVVLLAAAVAIAAVVIYYHHMISKLESNWRSSLSPDVPWVVVVLFLLLVAAVVGLAAVVICRKSSELKRHMKENGQKHQKQDTDDPATEETKLA